MTMMALVPLLLTLAHPAAAGFTVRFESVSIVNTGSAAGGSVSGVPENFYAVREGGAWAPSAATIVGRVAPWQSANNETPGLSLEQRWRVSATGGERWEALSPMLPEFTGATYALPLQDGGLRYPSGAHTACAATRAWNGDARWHTPDLLSPMTSDGWASLGAVEFHVVDGKLTQTANPLAAWSWQGVDKAGGMNVEASRRWYAPRIFSPLPLPASAGGGYVAVVAVFLKGNETINFSGHLSLLAFRSADGLQWHYTATVVKGDNRLQKLGPTEPDLAVLADGKSLFCVIRVRATALFCWLSQTRRTRSCCAQMDGDGACGKGGYKYYYQSYSTVRHMPAPPLPLQPPTCLTCASPSSSAPKPLSLPT